MTFDEIEGTGKRPSGPLTAAELAELGRRVDTALGAIGGAMGAVEGAGCALQQVREFIDGRKGYALVRFAEKLVSAADYLGSMGDTHDDLYCVHQEIEDGFADLDAELAEEAADTDLEEAPVVEAFPAPATAAAGPVLSAEDKARVDELRRRFIAQSG